MFLSYYERLEKYLATSDFCFMRNTQVTRVQSSMNVTNQRAPETLATLDGPQTSLSIK